MGNWNCWPFEKDDGGVSNYFEKLTVLKEEDEARKEKIQADNAFWLGEQRAAGTPLLGDKPQTDAGKPQDPGERIVTTIKFGEEFKRAGEILAKEYMSAAHAGTLKDGKVIKAIAPTVTWGRSPDPLYYGAAALVVQLVNGNIWLYELSGENPAGLSRDFIDMHQRRLLQLQDGTDVGKIVTFAQALLVATPQEQPPTQKNMPAITSIRF